MQGLTLSYQIICSNLTNKVGLIQLVHFESLILCFVFCFYSFTLLNFEIGSGCFPRQVDCFLLRFEDFYCLWGGGLSVIAEINQIHWMFKGFINNDERFDIHTRLFSVDIGF